MHRTRNYGSKVFAKGLMRDRSKHGKLLACSPRLKHVYPVMPGEFDLRKRVAPPENQMACGGCWAFSTTNSLRSLYMLQGRDPGPLSKNFLLYNIGPHIENGCYGGDFDAGLNMLDGRGPCLESLSPFTGRDTGAVYPLEAPIAATANRWVLVGDGCNRPTAQQIVEAIWNGGKGACLSADICADDTIENYRDGVITGTTSMAVNHMVRVVGWNAGASIDRNGNAVFKIDGSWADPRGAYFIMRNNWDLEWGIEGDCYIAYGVNNLAETAMLFE